MTDDTHDGSTGLGAFQVIDESAYASFHWLPMMGYIHPWIYRVSGHTHHNSAEKITNLSSQVVQRSCCWVVRVLERDSVMRPSEQEKLAPIANSVPVVDESARGVGE